LLFPPAGVSNRRYIPANKRKCNPFSEILYFENHVSIIFGAGAS